MSDQNTQPNIPPEIKYRQPGAMPDPNHHWLTMHKLLKYAFFFACFMAVLAIAAVAYSHQVANSIPTYQSPAHHATTNSTADKTYTNSQYGFELKYPVNFTITPNSESTSEFTLKFSNGNIDEATLFVQAVPANMSLQSALTKDNVGECSDFGGPMYPCHPITSFTFGSITGLTSQSDYYFIHNNNLYDFRSDLDQSNDDASYYLSTFKFIGDIPTTIKSPTPDEIVPYPGSSASYVKDEVDITLKSNTQNSTQTIEEIADQYNASILGSIPEVNDYQLHFNNPESFDQLKAIIAELEKLPEVQSAEFDLIENMDCSRPC